LLAPSKEACSLAVLKPIIGSRIVALAAGGRDAEVRLHTGSEFVVVDATETKSLFAAGILFLTHILRIGKSSLVISTASTSHCSLQTWCGGACGEACTSGEVVLCWFCAVKASLLAPSEEACSLAILKTVISRGIVALTAGSRDAEV